ncbi:hypothetical protein M7I_8059 [Glarea lozoyensis 74030]|uniref:Uncharacterized protein n=1 Tax=Glarea lozoyensis (strain ATCC 74030 / MF5533) TaxID=1104152 RepID=H0EYZ7_GLAL7|nr:hypothetical protein M7I_8059 [Glarea lozoyensis 74030]
MDSEGDDEILKTFAAGNDIDHPSIKVDSKTGEAAPTAPTTDVAAELRAEGGVTQGELLRQEQRAGVVPVAQLSSNRGDTDGLGEEDEAPHARGPDEIGMEDTGPQASGHAAVGSGLNVSMKGIDVDAAVGRKEVPVSPKRDADEEIGGQEKKVKDGDEEMGDEVELVDVDGRKEGEGVGEKGENKGVDAVDGSVIRISCAQTAVHACIVWRKLGFAA